MKELTFIEHDKNEEPKMNKRSEEELKEALRVAKEKFPIGTKFISPWFPDISVSSSEPYIHGTFINVRTTSGDQPGIYCIANGAGKNRVWATIINDDILSKYDQLKSILSEAHIIKEDGLNDGSGNWIEIKKRDEDKVVSVNFGFEDGEFTGIEIWETPLIEDDDNTRRLL